MEEGRKGERERERERPERERTPEERSGKKSFVEKNASYKEQKE